MRSIQLVLAACTLSLAVESSLEKDVAVRFLLQHDKGLGDWYRQADQRSYYSSKKEVARTEPIGGYQSLHFSAHSGAKAVLGSAASAAVGASATAAVGAGATAAVGAGATAAVGADAVAAVGAGATGEVGAGATAVVDADTTASIGKGNSLLPDQTEPDGPQKSGNEGSPGVSATPEALNIVDSNPILNEGSSEHSPQSEKDDVLEISDLPIELDKSRKKENLAHAKGQAEEKKKIDEPYEDGDGSRRLNAERRQAPNRQHMEITSPGASQVHMAVTSFACERGSGVLGSPPRSSVSHITGYEPVEAYEERESHIRSGYDWRNWPLPGLPLSRIYSRS